MKVVVVLMVIASINLMMAQRDGGAGDDSIMEFGQEALEDDPYSDVIDDGVDEQSRPPPHAIGAREIRNFLKTT